MHLLDTVFQKLAKERTFKLRVIGNFQFQLNNVEFEYFDWNKEDEAAQLQGMDIGVLVKTEEEWLEKLKYLIDNPIERERIGKNARQTVLQKFSIEANKPVYLQILKSLV